MNNIKKILIILLGNTLYALAVALFILPNNLITGGTTGLALVFQHQLGIPVSAFVGVFNVVMFILGGDCIRKIFCTYYYYKYFLLSIHIKHF